MINVEEIKLSDTLSIWKSKFDTSNINKMIQICESVIKNLPGVKTDGYPYYVKEMIWDRLIDFDMDNELDVVKVQGINSIITLFNKPFNELKTDIWVNVVRAKDPVQKNYKESGSLIFHNHVEINERNKMPPPHYTFVCYIQMPDNLSGNDGVLFMEDVDKKVYSVLPEEGDILIMKGDLPHVPNYASNSTKDRIVLAGNVRLDFSKLKKSLI